jgi:hypothetical protein
LFQHLTHAEHRLVRAGRPGGENCSLQVGRCGGGSASTRRCNA